jgi:hypothetical protein
MMIWIDADTVLVDDRHDLSLLPIRARPLALVAPHDHEQNDGQALANMGVTAVRSCQFTRRLFDRLWGMTRYVDHKWWENAALLDLLDFDLSCEPMARSKRNRIGHRIRWLDIAWNSIYLHPSPSPIIKHYPGASH